MKRTLLAALAFALSAIPTVALAFRHRGAPMIADMPWPDASDLYCSAAMNPNGRTM